MALARTYCRSDEAEDVLQEVWLVALRSVELHEARSPSSWLRAVTVNIARSRGRTEQRRRRLYLGWLAREPEADQADTKGTVDSVVARALWSEIEALPALQREVLLLRVVEELSTSEVAERLHRAEGTVKASLHGARKRLASRLKDQARG